MCTGQSWLVWQSWLWHHEARIYDHVRDHRPLAMYPSTIAVPAAYLLRLGVINSLFPVIGVPLAEPNVRKQVIFLPICNVLVSTIVRRVEGEN